MTALGILTGMLQLVVPSYAFRLVRRYGAQRVGWFIVAAFACLALLHMALPMQGSHLGIPAEQLMNALLIVGSILLLIGMGHVETVCSVREQTEKSESLVREQSQTEFFEKTTELRAANEILSRELAQIKERAEALAVSASQFHSLFIHNPVPLCVVKSPSGEILSMNDAAAGFFGRSQGQTPLRIQDCADPIHVPAIERALAESGPSPICFEQTEFLRADGSCVSMDWRAVDLPDANARLIAFHDVTQRLQNESALLKSHRMAAVIRMSGVLGKRFGTILGTIEENTAALSQRIQDAGAASNLQAISSALTRGSALARQLLAAGSQHALQTELLDLNVLLRSMNPLLSRLVGERIILQQAYGTFTSPVLVDPRLIEHVVVNLVLNAREAIRERGTITLSTGTVRFENDAANPAAPAGNFVVLAVRDTGRGIKPEFHPHVFEPFHSQGNAEESMGLGLASVYGVIVQHSGWVEFDSAPDRGTEFRVYLPCARSHEPERQSGNSPVEATGTRETVLLVEPDDRNRVTARCALNWAGYRVIEADSSSLGLLLWESQSEGIDLLLTDAQLNDGISGLELANRLQTSKPELRVVFTAEICGGELPIQADNWKIVSKPFTRDQLLNAISEVLQS